MLRGLVVLLLLVLTACGTGGSGTGDDAGAAPGASATGSGAEAGSGSAEPADLDFTATTLEGKAFEGASLAGSPTVLWFWAPWCPTCRAQIPTVSGLADEYDGRVDVVAVGGLDSESEIEALAGDIDHVTHLVDAEGVVWQHFGVTAQSTYTVLDADGLVVSEGYLEDADLEDLVAELAG